ncbi:MAG TPA: HAD family hydrolase [Rectinemataceae bacterium]|nr:HAD family hydrolase [Rectinemataceae bacterium]
MTLKAVAFDLDGTLYPAGALYIRAWPIALRNLKLARAFDETRRRVRGTEATEACRVAGSACADELRRLQADYTAAQLGWSAERVAAQLDEVLYRQVAECFGTIRPYRGAREALHRLRDAGLRLAVLSDFPPRRKLELMKLSDLFEVALCAEESGFLKPAPEPFAMLCSALGLRADEILYVGNSRRYDLAGAKDFGMPVAIRAHHAAPGADLTFSDWKTLTDFVFARR